MTVIWGAGFHTAIGRPVDSSAYGQYVGRWSQLFVPALLAVAEVNEGHWLLDVATGPGQAVLAAISAVGRSGRVVGSDIAPAMLQAARARFPGAAFQAVTSDGQALPFSSSTFDAVVCQLGLMFFADPARGLAEFRRVLRPGRRAAVCVIAEPERAPMWGLLADAVSRYLPDQREALHLSFALADHERIERLFSLAGFRDVRTSREVRA